MQTNSVNSADLENLVSSRLDDMAKQIYQLLLAGRDEEASLLKREGLELAEAVDSGYEFFYATDFNHQK